MIKKKKIIIIISVAIIALIYWIISMHIKRINEMESREYHLLSTFEMAFMRLSVPLEEFESAVDFEDQLSCLKEITKELRRISCYIEISYPQMNIEGSMLHSDYELVASFIDNGGTINSHRIPSFKEDKQISKKEQATIEILLQETETLRKSMMPPEVQSGKENIIKKYALSPSELYEQLKSLIDKVNAQIYSLP